MSTAVRQNSSPWFFPLHIVPGESLTFFFLFLPPHTRSCSLSLPHIRKDKVTLEGVSKEGVVQPSPTFLAPGTSFTKDSFPTDLAGQGGGNGLGIIQVHYIYCALYFYYYYISSTSDHQALDPGGWGTPSLSHLVKN